MQKLHDQLGLQHFLQECHEVGTLAVLDSDFFLREGRAPRQRGGGGGDAPSKWVAEQCSLRAARRRAEPGLSAHALQGPPRLRGLWGRREPQATARIRAYGPAGTRADLTFPSGDL